MSDEHDIDALRLEAIIDGRLAPSDDVESGFADLVRELRADATPAPPALRARVTELAESGAPRRSRWWSAARPRPLIAAVGGRAAIVGRPVAAALAPLLAVAALAFGVLPSSTITTQPLDAKAGMTSAAPPAPQDFGERTGMPKTPAGSDTLGSSSAPVTEPPPVQDGSAGGTAPLESAPTAAAPPAGAGERARPDAFPAWRWALSAGLGLAAAILCVFLAAPAAGRRRSTTV